MTLNPHTSPISRVTNTPPFFNDFGGEMCHVIVTFTTFNVEIFQGSEPGVRFRIVKPNCVSKITSILDDHIEALTLLSIERRANLEHSF